MHDIHIIKELISRMVKRCFETTNTESSLPGKKPRNGKWSFAEELYTNRLILDFVNGAISDSLENESLRCYLARKLDCSKMRISKKFAGRHIGKVCSF